MIKKNTLKHELYTSILNNNSPEIYEKFSQQRICLKHPTVKYMRFFFLSSLSEAVCFLCALRIHKANIPHASFTSIFSYRRASKYILLNFKKDEQIILAYRNLLFYSSSVDALSEAIGLLLGRGEKKGKSVNLKNRILFKAFYKHPRLNNK